MTDPCDNCKRPWCYDCPYQEEEEQTMIECYVGNYVAFKEFGKTKITSKDNYEAVIRDANKVITFDGTIHEAVEYIKQNFGGAL